MHADVREKIVVLLWAIAYGFVQATERKCGVNYREWSAAGWTLVFFDDAGECDYLDTAIEPNGTGHGFDFLNPDNDEADGRIGARLCSAVEAFAEECW